MKKQFILFDMDGVLLKPGGYHQALMASVNRIGKALGAPEAELTLEQIAQFEALSVTNEWDTLAICTALILLQAWRIDGTLRLTADITPRPLKILPDKPDFGTFLNTFDKVGPLPALSAYQKIIKENHWLNSDQKNHLEKIVSNCRDIYNSMTLPTHQEAVLGSQAFQANYGLKPQLNTESYLQKFDEPAMPPDQFSLLKAWLEEQNHYTGILTNRPNATPSGYVSAPEAEIGARLVGMEGVPLLGSGMLNWFAEVQCGLPQHTFLKPNPVHALGLMQICLGQSPAEALAKAAALWRGESEKNPWLPLDRSHVTIFEDSVKGLQSGIAAISLLRELDIRVELRLVGVSDNPIKKKALLGIADEIIPTITDNQWAV